MHTGVGIVTRWAVQIMISATGAKMDLQTFLAAVALACVVVGAGHAKASDTVSEAKNAGDWVHNRTGFTFPVELAGGQRVEVKDPHNRGLDVSLHYEAHLQGWMADIFLTAHGYGGVDVWFDRAQSAIRTRGRYQKSVQPVTFSLPGSAYPTGLIAVYADEPGSRYGNTALAMVPIRGLMVKFQISSEHLLPDQLASILLEMVSTLRAVCFHFAAYPA